MRSERRKVEGRPLGPGMSCPHLSGMKRAWERVSQDKVTEPGWEDNAAVPTEQQTGVMCQSPNGVRRVAV